MSRPQTIKVQTDPNDPTSIIEIDASLPEEQQLAVIEGATRARERAKKPKAVPSSSDFKVVGALDAADQPTSKSILDRIRENLPSSRTIARVVGAGIGGAAGLPLGPAGIATGGAYGGAGGDAAYQIAQQLTGKQTEADPAGITEAALTGAMQEGIGAMAAPAAGDVIRAGLRRQVGNVVKPVTEAEQLAIREAAEDIAPRIPVAATDTALFKSFKSQLNSSVQKLDSAYNSVPQSQTFSSAPIVGELTQARTALDIGGKVTPGLTGQAQTYDELIDWFTEHPDFTLAELRKNRQLWDKLVNWGRSSRTNQPQTEEAYEVAANSIREFINSRFPKIANLNEQVAQMKDVVDIFGRAEIKPFGKTSPTFSDLMVGGTGGAIGGMAGGPGGAAGGAAVGIAAKQIMQSPLWRTASIAVRQKALELLNQGNVAGAVNLLVGAGASQGLTEGAKATMSVTAPE